MENAIHRLHRLIWAIGVICGLSLVALAQQQQFANIGDLKLENGGVIRDGSPRLAPYDKIGQTLAIDPLKRRRRRLLIQMNPRLSAFQFFV